MYVYKGIYNNIYICVFWLLHIAAIAAALQNKFWLRQQMAYNPKAYIYICIHRYTLYNVRPLR